MGLSRGVKGCIGKYLAAELLMKTARPDAMDVGFWCGSLVAILA